MNKNGTWGLLAFGMVLGLLTALNTTAGLTAALVALLFTFVGSSLISLYKPDTLKDADRPAIFTGVGLLSVGMLVAMLVGFLLRLLDAGCIQPWIAERNDRAAVELKAQLKDTREKFKEIREQLEKKYGKPADEDWKKIAASLKKIGENLDAYAENIQKAEKAKKDEKKGTFAFVFQVQGDEEKKAGLDAVQGDLRADNQRSANDKEKLTQEEREDHQSFAAALERSKPGRHLAPAVAESVKKMIDENRLTEPTRKVLARLLN